MQLPSHSDPTLRSRTGTSGGLPQSTVPSFRLIDSELGQVKSLIDEQLAEVREPVSRLLGCANIHGGKLIRPGLVLLSYRAVRDGSFEKGTTAKGAAPGSPPEGVPERTYGEDAEKNAKLRKSATSGDSAASENIRNTQYDAIRVAAIVELIHNATLLHDDVMDGGQNRRGQPTVNSLWGNETAVLLGDFLLGKAFRICATLDPEITNIIAGTAVRVCEGELRQVTERRNWQLSESEYIDIITEKSAALFSSCCLLGASLAGASEAQSQSLACFGLNTGIAFQITDDLVDIIGDESKTGKTLGSDIDKNKLTLAVIHLLRALDQREKSAVINSYLERVPRCEKESLAEMLVRFGSVEYTRIRTQEFVTKALGALAELKEGRAKDALIETAKFIGQRAI